MFNLRTVMLTAVLYFTSCSSNLSPEDQFDLLHASWDTITQQAQGSNLTMMMWQGDPLINSYMTDYVVPKLRELHGIDLKLVDGQGSTIVTTLMAELEAGKAQSDVDLIWINGETFFQLRQIDALYGPFVDKLPNSQYIDWDNPFISYDFQQPIDGYECPWGNVQLALIYNSEKVPDPPQTLAELEEWVQAHPGKFTIGNDFTGMTLLKSWLIHLAGGQGALSGPFDEAKYKQYSKELWAYLRRIRPYLWNEGESFPNSVAAMHQLFVTGELWFTMSNNDAEVDNKIQQGVFADNSRAYVPLTGTIQNSHYLGIVKHAAHKAAALATINFLISPAAQLHKMEPQIWGDATVLDRSRLPKEWQMAFDSIPGRRYAPQREDIQDRALMEPAPEYMIRLFEDFRREVIEQ
ncbi:MAG: ABC transporter substrate-binding protein [Bacteroidetes bacterium]|nr:MAG: ABC transporter substrate-binding protein [Bacteroidota bacterium]